MNRFSIQHLLLLSLWFPISARLSAAEPPARFEFTRMIAHWDAYGDDKNYLSFVDECQPEVAQVGFYGAHFWSLGHTDQYGGYPSHLPVKGLKECGDWFERMNGELHKRNVKACRLMAAKYTQFLLGLGIGEVASAS